MKRPNVANGVNRNRGRPLYFSLDWPDSAHCGSVPLICDERDSLGYRETDNLENDVTNGIRHHIVPIAEGGAIEQPFLEGIVLFEGESDNSPDTNVNQIFGGENCPAYPDDMAL
jgi:hypothetical protein